MNSLSLKAPAFSLALGLMHTRHKKPLEVYYPFVLKITTESEEVITELLATFTAELWETGFTTLKSSHLVAFKETLEKHLPDVPPAVQTLPKTLLKTLLHSFTQLLPLVQQTETQATPEEAYTQKSWILSVIQTKTDNPLSVPDIYHRLMLISTRQAQPHELSLAGIFAMLPNIAWTNRGPVLAEEIEPFRLKHALANEPLIISHVDKFPYLINYHIPSGVRIADGSRVRLGAYLGKGSTIMPAGYVNFNAGTQGEAMIEGRISAGVFVGAESDLGGGSSIMGTLSGGGKEVITIAPKCLIGANAGTGISLGFGSTIAAGVYVTAGAKVHLYDAANHPITLTGKSVTEGENIVKALDLSGRENLLFYTDSHSGKLICKPNPKTIELNSTLHKN